MKNNFYKSLIWMMDNDDECMEVKDSIFEKNVDEFFYGDRDILQIMKSRDSKVYCEGKNYGKIQMLLNMLFYTKRLVNEFEQDDYEESIQSMIEGFIFMNSLFSSILMEYVFQRGESLDFGVNYMPSNEIISYLNVMEKDYTIRKLYSSKLSNRYYKNLLKYDKQVIAKHLDFINILVILLVIIEAPFYTENIKTISKSLLELLTNILVDCRVCKVIVEPNMFGSEYESGSHVTTKMEIFFLMSNQDRYCLRIDFPHDQYAYIHFNIHEPGKKAGTGLPIFLDEYDTLQSVCSKDISLLFYEYGKQFWFRSDFESKLHEIFPEKSEEYSVIIKKYKEKCHVRLSEDDVKKEDMKDILLAFVEGMHVMKIDNCLYEKTKTVDIEFELQKIRMNSIVQEMFMLLDEIECKNNIYGTDVEIEDFKLKVLERFQSNFDYLEISHLEKDKMLEMSDCEFLECLEEKIDKL